VLRPAVLSTISEEPAVQQQQQLSLIPMPTHRPALRSVTEYGYAENSPLMKRMPLSTVPEARSSVFPATNNVVVPGQKGVPASGQAPYELVYADGGILRVHGPRRERHRRFLDFILAYAQPVVLAERKLGFFICRKEAARAVFGKASSYLLIDALGIEMQQIRIQYVLSGFNDGVGDVQPLCASYKSSYRHGVDTKEDGLDAALTKKGFDAKSFEGLAFIALGEMYCERFLAEMTMRYHPALDTIFAMDIVSASIARFALSNEYLRARPLSEVLDLIGAPSGGTRDRTIAELKNGREAKYLARLGITIRIHAGKNCVYYDKDKAPQLTVHSLGMYGAAAAKQGA
jgi:hypothetical protein